MKELSKAEAETMRPNVNSVELDYTRKYSGVRTDASE